MVRLVTQRLQMCPLSHQDAEGLFHLNNDPEVLKYTGDKPFKSIEEVRNFINNYDQYAKYGLGRFSVRCVNDHSFFGWCGLKRLDSGETELGYRFLRRHWGKGYATEAGLRQLQYGFEACGLTGIIARVIPENNASIRVMIKLGMSFREEAMDGDIPIHIYKIDL